jgi:hypothetical protein
MSIRSANLRRSVALMLLTVTVAIASACGDKDTEDDASTPRPTTTTTEPTTTATSLDQDAQKIEAAKAAWAAAATDPVQPRLPEVQALMTGDFESGAWKVSSTDFPERQDRAVPCVD